MVSWGMVNCKTYWVWLEPQALSWGSDCTGITQCLFWGDGNGTGRKWSGHDVGGGGGGLRHSAPFSDFQKALVSVPRILLTIV